MNFKWSLYILDSSPLSDVSFENISSQFMAFPPILLTLSYSEQKFLNKMESSLSNGSFVAHAFPVSKMSSPYSWPSSIHFIVFHFTFKSKIHFELLFVKDVRSVSRLLLFFGCGYPLALLPFVEKTILGPLYCLFPFVKEQLTVFMWVYFGAFHSVPLIY